MVFAFHERVQAGAAAVASMLFLLGQLLRASWLPEPTILAREEGKPSFWELLGRLLPSKLAGRLAQLNRQCRLLAPLESKSLEVCLGRRHEDALVAPMSRKPTLWNPGKGTGNSDMNRQFPHHASKHLRSVGCALQSRLLLFDLFGLFMSDCFAMKHVW